MLHELPNIDLWLVGGAVLGLLVFGYIAIFGKDPSPNDPAKIKAKREADVQAGFQHARANATNTVPAPAGEWHDADLESYSWLGFIVQSVAVIGLLICGCFLYSGWTSGDLKETLSKLTSAEAKVVEQGQKIKDQETAIEVVKKQAKEKATPKTFEEIEGADWDAKKYIAVKSDYLEILKVPTGFVPVISDGKSKTSKRLTPETGKWSLGELNWPKMPDPVLVTFRALPGATVLDAKSSPKSVAVTK